MLPLQTKGEVNRIHHRPKNSPLKVQLSVGFRAAFFHEGDEFRRVRRSSAVPFQLETSIKQSIKVTAMPGGGNLERPMPPNGEREIDTIKLSYSKGERAKAIAHKESPL